MKRQILRLTTFLFTAPAMVAMLVISLPDTASAQQAFTSFSEEENTSVLAQPLPYRMQLYESRSAKLRYLRDHFSEADLSSLGGISEKVFEEFSVEELELIVARESRGLKASEAVHSELFERYDQFLNQQKEDWVQNRSYPSSITMVFDDFFSDGISSSFEAVDLSGSGFRWKRANNFSNYPAAVVANSDGAGEDAGQVQTSLVSTSFITGEGQNFYLYISHDYRHTAGGSATIEFLNADGEWTELAGFSNSNRFAVNIIKIPDDELGMSSQLRFTYDDGGSWGWWWLIDQVGVFVTNQDKFISKDVRTLDRQNGNFERVSPNLGGLLEQISFDLSVNQVTGLTHTRAFTILLTDGDQVGDDIVLQIGGNSQISTAENWLSWDAGPNDNDIEGLLELDEPLDLNGLTLWTGHFGFGSAVANWSGSFEFNGVSYKSGLQTAYENPLDTEYENAVVVGFYDEPAGSVVWLAEKFEINAPQLLTGVSATMFNPAGNISYENLISSVELIIFEDENDAPASLPDDGSQPYLRFSAEVMEDHFSIVQISEDNFTIFADIQGALGTQWVMEPGEYWLAIAPVVEEVGLLDVSGRNYWAPSETSLSDPVIYDPGDIFSIGASDSWQPTTDSNPTPALAFAIYSGGSPAGSDEIIPAPAAALTGSVDDNSGEVSLQWLSPVSNGFMESFSGTIRELEITDELWQVQDGYLLRDFSDPAQQIPGYAYHPDTFTDFFVEAEMRIDGDGGVAGLFFRGELPDDFNQPVSGYLFLLFNIEGTLFYAVTRPGSPVVRFLRSSPYLSEDPFESNIFSVNANGTQIDLFINGEYEFTFSSDQFLSGKTGLLGLPGLEEGVNLTYDYFALIDEPLEPRENPKMISLEEFGEPAVGMEGFTAESLFSEAVAVTPEGHTGMQRKAEGLLQPLTQSGLMSPGSERFLEFEIWRNGSLTGTTTGTSFTDQLTDPGTYEYEVRAVYGYAEAEFSNSVEISFNPVSIPEDPTQLPAELALSQNYPNPFNPVTQIQYALPEAGEVRIEVYNVNGQRVALLANGQQAAGRHQVSFDGSALSSGVYLYRLQTATGVISRKMMLVK